MILTRLKGGLGNQMFQYACGRALSLRTKNTLKLDVSDYSRQGNLDTPRTYSLSHFMIKEDIATADEISKLKYPFGIISKGQRFLKIKLFRKFNIGFDPQTFRKINSLGPRRNIYLDGFWQTAKYFEDQVDIIRQEFRLKEPAGTTAIHFSEQIKKNSDQGVKNISLHVRRGDISASGQGNNYYGISTPEYYSKAFDYIATHVGKSTTPKEGFHVFIFSDEPEWVSKNIQIPYPFTIVSGKQIPDYEELLLMSQCEINIAANSTFSWWAGWLNSNQNKLVITPKRWAMRGEEHHVDTVPTSWIRL